MNTPPAPVPFGVALRMWLQIGWLMHRTASGVAAGVLFVLPSLFILIALSGIYCAWGQGIEWPALVLALATGVALIRYRRSVIQVIAASALLGLAWTLLRP